MARHACHERVIKKPPSEVAVPNVHWVVKKNSKGRNRWICTVSTCERPGNYSRKDSLNRHLAEHDMKTPPGRRGKPRKLVSAARGSIPSQARGSWQPSEGASRRTVPSWPTEVGGLGETSNSKVRFACESLPSSGDGDAISLTNSQGRPRMANVDVLGLCPKFRRPTQGSMPVEVTQSISDCRDHETHDTQNSSPLAFSRYLPNVAIITGEESIQEIICLASDGTEIAKYYVDCHFDLMQEKKSTRGDSDRRPIVIHDSPQAPRYQQGGKGTLNVRWEGGGKCSFWVPIGTRRIEVIRGASEQAPDLSPVVAPSRAKAKLQLPHSTKPPSSPLGRNRTSVGSISEKKRASVGSISENNRASFGSIPRRKRTSVNSKSVEKEASDILRDMLLEKTHPACKFVQVPVLEGSPSTFPSLSQLPSMSQFPPISQIPTLSELSLPALSPSSPAEVDGETEPTGYVAHSDEENYDSE